MTEDNQATDVVSLKTDAILVLSDNDEAFVISNEFPEGTEVEVSVGDCATKKAVTRRQESAEDPYYLAVSRGATDYTFEQIENFTNTATTLPATIVVVNNARSTEDQMLIDVMLDKNA